MQDLLGSESAGAAEKLAAAAKVEKELRHQLGKVRFVAKEMQDMHTALYEEKEAALAKVPLSIVKEFMLLQCEDLHNQKHCH